MAPCPYLFGTWGPGTLVLGQLPSHVTTQEPDAPSSLDVTTHGVVVLPQARIQSRTSEHAPHGSPESPCSLRELHGEGPTSQDQKAVLFFTV